MAKPRYHVRNWNTYNAALVQRGSLYLWIAEDVTESWFDRRTHRRGRPQIFSDAAIRCALTLRAVFRLPLRQTEGFLQSIFRMMHLNLPVPDYSTLCLRSRTLSVPLQSKKKSPAEDLHLVLDSTGLKIRGEGEWRRGKHGKSGHRKWRKFHLGIDPQTGAIVVQELTTSHVHDATAGARLIHAAPDSLVSVTADGAYDKLKVYLACHRRNVHPVIPPQKNAKIQKWWHKDPEDGQWKHHVPYLADRNDNIRSIRKRGRKRWKQESDYHRRSLVEATISRFIRLFGPALRSKRIARQRTEVAIRCSVLNLMTGLGMPDTIRVA